MSDNPQIDLSSVEDMVKQQLSSQCLSCIGPDNRHYEGYVVTDPIQEMEDEICKMVLVECKNCGNKWWGRV